MGSVRSPAPCTSQQHKGQIGGQRTDDQSGLGWSLENLDQCCGAGAYLGNVLFFSPFLHSMSMILPTSTPGKRLIVNHFEVGATATTSTLGVLCTGGELMSSSWTAWCCLILRCHNLVNRVVSWFTLESGTSCLGKSLQNGLKVSLSWVHLKSIHLPVKFIAWHQQGWIKNNKRRCTVACIFRKFRLTTDHNRATTHWRQEQVPGELIQAGQHDTCGVHWLALKGIV